MADDTTLFQFHHVQLFVNHVKPLDEYKRLEERLNALSRKGNFNPFSGAKGFLEPSEHDSRVQEGKSAWQEVCKDSGVLPETFQSSGQDIVEQLLVGLGWRVTAEYDGVGTRSVLVTSADPCGVKMCITSARICGCVESDEDQEPYAHFSSAHVKRTAEAHSGRQCIGVLGFEVSKGVLQDILERYQKLHPDLLVQDVIYEYKDTRVVKQSTLTSSSIDLGTMRVLEVFAYYRNAQARIPDTGTVLRFVERDGTFASRPGFSNPEGVLPGLRDTDPHFDDTSIPAYSDHWVSNVQDRIGFLETLNDTLGFVPKVEFNAGVVAAGRAQIESTVVGNSNAPPSSTQADALKNQSQVYLPVNNALSDVGHVHAFLQQLGQGVQHLASRVVDLVSFVERVNNYREMTGRGFSFLSIPRSYYGILRFQDLVSAGASEALAAALMRKLQESGEVSKEGVVDLTLPPSRLQGLDVGPSLQAEWEEKQGVLAETVLRGRYKNIFDLLGDSIAESLYLQIVRNQILIDVQGGDILFQIFTCKVLQAQPEHEAPFLEFIQRLCSECRDVDGDAAEACRVPIKAGCGGFGIRNFLTLFLSIELSKALQDQLAAEAQGDAAGAAGAAHRVSLLTQQLQESNPILTSISDAMAEEGELLQAMAAQEDPQEKARMQSKAQELTEKKKTLTASLQALSERYAHLTSLPPPLIPEL